MRETRITDPRGYHAALQAKAAATDPARRAALERIVSEYEARVTACGVTPVPTQRAARADRRGTARDGA